MKREFLYTYTYTYTYTHTNTHAHIHNSEKLWNCLPLVQNENRTSGSALVTNLNRILTNIDMVKIVAASE